MADMVEYRKDCPFCGQENSVIVPAEGLKRWLAGEYVQVALPRISAADREVLITGVHDECWNKYVKDE